MTVGLDTSVVMRLLTGEPRDQAGLALRFLQERTRRGDRLLVADWVIAETYYALQHHYGAEKAEALDALREFLRDSGVEGTGEVAKVLETPNLAKAKPGFIDRLIYHHYQQAQADHVATFERAAGRLPGMLVLGA